MKQPHYFILLGSLGARISIVVGISRSWTLSKLLIPANVFGRIDNLGWWPITLGTNCKAPIVARGVQANRIILANGTLQLRNSTATVSFQGILVT